MFHFAEVGHASRISHPQSFLDNYFQCRFSRCVVHKSGKRAFSTQFINFITSFSSARNEYAFKFFIPLKLFVR